jgi:hypothetical protein
MSIASARLARVLFSGDIIASIEQEASNATSPGVIEVLTLASGNNTITVPNDDVTGVTIIPPPANEETITLKGVNGDTGIRLHLTDPCSIGIDAAVVTTFVLSAGAEIVGVRFIWS